MQKEVIVAQEGFEDYFEYLNSKIENIEVDKEAEKDKVIAEIDAKYEVKLAKFKNALADISETKYEEVPDEEVAEENVENGVN